MLYKTFPIKTQITMQEPKRQRMADLLRAEIDPKRIAAIVKVSLYIATVYNVRARLAEGKTSARSLEVVDQTKMNFSLCYRERQSKRAHDANC
jgi:hypothetical protein